MNTIFLVTSALSLALSGLACAQQAPAPAAQSAKPAAKTPVAALDAIVGEVQTGDALHFIAPAALKAGQAVELVLTNAGKTPVRGTLAIAINERPDVEPKFVTVGPIAIAARGEARQKLTAAQIGPGLGIKYLDWKIEADGRIATGFASFAVIEPVGQTAGPARGFIFGNGGVLNGADPEDLARAMRMAAIVGAKSVRLGAAWRVAQPASDKFDWADLDGAIDAAEKAGMEVQLLVAYGGAPWTKSPETLARVKANGDDNLQWRYPPRDDAWRAWTRALAQRYRGRVRYYEVWNEPDLEFWKGSAPEYVEILRAASQEIHAVDPDAKVMTGGFGAMDQPTNDPEVLKLTLAASDSFDLLAYHRHGLFPKLRNEIDNRLLPMMKEANVSKPLYFNETALGSNYQDEYRQAVELPKRVAFLWSRGAVAWHYFKMWERGRGSGKSRKDGGSGNYNMVRGDFSPRAVWVAYNEMARALRGRTFVEQLEVGEGRWAFSFRGRGDFTGAGDDDYAIVAWTQDDILADAPLVMSVGEGATASLVDLMGNSTPVPVSQGRLILPVRAEPRYLLIAGAKTKPAPQGALLVAERAGAVAPGQSQTVRVELHNPLVRAAKARLTWSASAPLRTDSPLVVEQTIAAGGTASATLQVSLPAQARSRGNESRAVTASYQIEGTTLATTTAIPVALGVRVPAADWNARPADFDLQRSSDVVNTMDIEPATQQFAWRGPQDLSAQAWLRRGKNSLDLRFEVRDDVHRQPYRGNSLWQGDSIQMALAVPGQSGYFELGLERTDAGQSLAHAFKVPRGFDGGELFKAIVIQTQREGEKTIYLAQLPYQAFGLSDQILRDGVRFSFVANDLDGSNEKAREGFVRLSEGIAGPKDPTRFPTIVMD